MIKQKEKASNPEKWDREKRGEEKEEWKREETERKRNDRVIKTSENQQRWVKIEKDECKMLKKRVKLTKMNTPKP
jgi:hypothetical protein